jgi:hypothetical protein
VIAAWVAFAVFLAVANWTDSTVEPAPMPTMTTPPGPCDEVGNQVEADACFDAMYGE